MEETVNQTDICELAGLTKVNVKNVDSEQLAKNFYEQDIEFAWIAGKNYILVHLDELNNVSLIINKLLWAS